MKREGQSHIVVTATEGSGSRVIFSCDRTIIHPQFHPSDPTVIEYAQDPAPRIWRIRSDGSENECLYEHGNDEFIVHETWLGHTGDLVFVRWPYALCRLRLEPRQKETIAETNAWHIAASQDGRKVLCDTAHPDRGIGLIDVATGEWTPVVWAGASCQGTQWAKDRYALADDWKAASADEKRRTLSWMEMKTDTVYGPQWTHPHPSFSPDERSVVYTSDVTGHAQAYVARIPGL
jgi:oligogalacturonide lyase